MGTTTNISSLVANLSMESISEGFKTRNNVGKPSFEPHLNRMFLSYIPCNKEFITTQEDARVAETTKMEEKTTSNKKNNNDDCNYVSYCNSNYDNNYCISNNVRVPFMCFSNFKLEIKRYIEIKKLISIMFGLIQRTYKLCTSIHRVVVVYRVERDGYRMVFPFKAIQAVLKAFFLERRLNVRSSVKTCLKWINDTKWMVELKQNACMFHLMVLGGSLNA